MAYTPSTDFVGLWRAFSNGVEKVELPGLDFVVAALSRAGILRVVTSGVPPTVNQSTTAWFQPANPSYGGEGMLFMWDPSLNVYVPATPELFHGGGGGNGGGGGGGSGMVIISSTPPSNPITGTEWWNGTVLQLWDGTQWKTVGPAQGPGSQPLETTTLTLSLTQQTILTLPGSPSTWQIVPYNETPTIDTLAGWDAATKKYTAKKPGYYAVNCRAIPNIGGAGTWTGIMILKNDSGVFDSNSIVIGLTNSNTGTWLTTTGFVQMNGMTDFIRVFGWSSSATPTIAASPAVNPVLSVLRMP